MKGKFLKVCMQKWEKMESKVIPSAGVECCCLWALWPSIHQERTIPKDVPKSHLVVYVGEENKRYVIHIALLEHPLFKALLDQAREKYNFEGASKLCIPCDDDMFLKVIRCVTSPKDRRMSMNLLRSIPGTCFNS